MRKVACAATAALLVLAGCGSEESAMTEACRSMLSYTVADPARLQVNETSLLSRDLTKGEAIAVLREQWGKDPAQSVLRALEYRYEPGKTPPKRHFVSIDYTDNGRPAASRGKAICEFYADGANTALVSAELAGQVSVSGMKGIMEFSLFRGQPEGLDSSGKLKQ